MSESFDLHEKREALLDELEKMIDKSEERRAINEEKAMAEISRLEDEIKKQKEINEKFANPAPGGVSSPLYISDTEYDSPPEDSEEDLPDEDELELMSLSKSCVHHSSDSLIFQSNKKELKTFQESALSQEDRETTSSANHSTFTANINF